MGLINTITSFLFGDNKNQKSNTEVLNRVSEIINSGQLSPTRKNNPIRRYKNELLRIDLVGVSYRVNVYNKIRFGSELDIKFEPNNQHDKNALAVSFNNELLGYLPRNHRRIIASFKDGNYSRCDVYSHQNQKVTVTIYFK